MALSAGKLVTVVALTQRIRWLDMGERANAAQHHHAWIVFDYARTRSTRPTLTFAE